MLFEVDDRIDLAQDGLDCMMHDSVLLHGIKSEEDSCDKEKMCIYS